MASNPSFEAVEDGRTLASWQRRGWGRARGITSPNRQPHHLADGDELILNWNQVFSASGASSVMCQPRVVFGSGGGGEKKKNQCYVNSLFLALG